MPTASPPGLIAEKLTACVTVQGLIQFHYRWLGEPG
jgi:uncharacterized protein involved in tolerance to divalent cations